MRIQLELAPEERWEAQSTHCEVVRALVDYYIKDLGGSGDSIFELGEELVPEEYRREIRGLARVTEMPYRRLLTANLYYDALKVLIGCTAFSLPNGLHARNLDWWSDSDLLSVSTQVQDFYLGEELRYRIVGWPGMVGCLSGVAPGRFSVTLNAVSSEAAPVSGIPVVFLLREVLENCTNFEEAKAQLSSTTIPCDCILMLTGTEQGQRVMIERKPTEARLREPESGILVATNDYRAFGSTATTSNPLSATAKSRYGRAVEMLAEGSAETVDDCFAILRDEGVKMSITAQSMVLEARSGEVSLFGAI